jgi:hypothetical protein
MIIGLPEVLCLEDLAALPQVLLLLGVPVEAVHRECVLEEARDRIEGYGGQAGQCENKDGSVGRSRCRSLQLPHVMVDGAGVGDGLAGAAGVGQEGELGEAEQQTNDVGDVCSEVSRALKSDISRLRALAFLG